MLDPKYETTARDLRVSSKIEGIRLATHGTLASPCPTCGQSRRAPYRRYNAAGEVEQGCVDASHTDYIWHNVINHRKGPSEAWHNTKAARAVRATMLKHLSEVSSG